MVQEEKEEKVEEEEEVRWLRSLAGWKNNTFWAKLKCHKIEICVHSHAYVFSFCLGVSRGVCFVCEEYEGGGGLWGFLILMQTMMSW